MPFFKFRILAQCSLTDVYNGLPMLRTHQPKTVKKIVMSNTDNFAIRKYSNFPINKYSILRVLYLSYINKIFKKIKISFIFIN